MQDIENAIKGLQSVPDEEGTDSNEAAPSPYGPSLPLPLSEMDEPVPHLKPQLHQSMRQAKMLSTSAIVPQGRGLLLSGKKRGIVNLLNRWIRKDERYKSKTSKTARVVGHVAGDLMGLLVSEQFRQMGMLAGGLAKAGVKEVATAGVDGLIRAIILHH